MKDDRLLFRVGGLCAGASALTTFLLWLLPRFYPAPAGFAASVGLHAEPLYMARLWVNFIHEFLALTGYAAAAAALWHRSRFLAGSGFLWFTLWAFTETIGVSINIWAVNRAWRSRFASADAEARAALETNLTGFAEVWDAMFFVILISFLLGTIFLGLAAVGGAGLERAVGVLLLLAAPLTVVILLSGYAGMPFLERFVTWSYPVLQPASRALMGVWLWRRAPAAVA